MDIVDNEEISVNLESFILSRSEVEDPDPVNKNG